MDDLRNNHDAVVQGTEKAGRFGNLDPESRMKEQNERDKEIALEINQSKIDSLSSYSDDQEVVIVESNHDSEVAINVGDARRHLNEVRKRLSESKLDKIDWSMAANDPFWSIKEGVNPNDYRKMVFAESVDTFV
ncbi:MAG: hypothetical protein Q7S47_02000 [bacterium]|nr:hypothetical protein [bacterium]